VAKVGAGTWTLTNINFYSGYTAVYDGTLALKDYGDISSSPAVLLFSDSATLKVTDLVTPTFYNGTNHWLVGLGTIAGSVESNGWISPSGPVSPSLGVTTNSNLAIGTMNVQNNLTLPGLDHLQFKIGGGQNDLIQVAGTLNMSNTSGYPTYVHLIPSGAIAEGTYTLISAASQTGTGTFDWDVLHPHNTRYGLTLDNTTAGQLKVTVTGSNDTITWSGPSGGTWDVITSANWTGPHDSLFWQGDAVQFTGETEDVEVNLLGDVTDAVLYPASILVSSSKNYTFSGAGKISSGAGITKSGAGTLTVANTGGNDFTGTVTITGGTLVAGSATALGSTLGETVIDGGTLDMGGHSIGKEPIRVQGGGAIVNTSSEEDLYDVTLSGEATFGGTTNWNVSGLAPSYGWQNGRLIGGGKTLTKTGANEIQLIDLGATNLGDVNVTEGTLTVTGSTDLGASTLTLSHGAKLKLSDSTVTQTKAFVVAATDGEIENASGDNAFHGNGSLDGTLTVTMTADTLTLGGALTGPGGITKDGEGTLTLTGNLNYSGDTTINSALLQVNSASATVGNVLGAGGLGIGNGVAPATMTARSVKLETLTIAAGSKLVIAPSSGGGAAAPVPEPGAGWLLLIGALGVAARRTIRFRR
jgi:fibronectin-binding autotransporter adhesin